MRTTVRVLSAANLETNGDRRLDRLDVRDDGVVAAGAGRLWADDLGNLQLAFGIRRADDGLIAPRFRRPPGIAPDDPRVGRHGRLNAAFVPGPAGIKADLHFADGVGSAECDPAQGVFGAAQGLIVARRIDARKNLDGAVVGPAFALPVAFIVTGIDFDFRDPFHVFDAVESGYDEADWEAVFPRQLLSIHQECQHDIVLHGAAEGNAVIVAVDGAEDDITRSFLVGSAFQQQFLERDAAPCGVAQAVASGQGVDAHQRGDLIVGVPIKELAPAKGHWRFDGAFDMQFPLFDIDVPRGGDGTIGIVYDIKF